MKTVCPECRKEIEVEIPYYEPQYYILKYLQILRSIYKECMFIPENDRQELGNIIQRGLEAEQKYEEQERQKLI
jgi:hypothetical protein